MSRLVLGYSRKGQEDGWHRHLFWVTARGRIKRGFRLWATPRYDPGPMCPDERPRP